MAESIKLNFQYSEKAEIERIMYTINRLDWYLKNGYSVSWMSFPSGIDKDNLANNSKEAIIEAVEKEYDSNRYLFPVEYLNQSYPPYGARLKKFIESLGLPIIPEIVADLTFYGLGGSYHVPNKVVSNLSIHQGKGLLKSILHETIHLHIQHLIDKYKVRQRGKETIVNLLLQTAFPEMPKENNVSIDISKIEAIFKENFPNIEKVISLVG